MLRADKLEYVVFLLTDVMRTSSRNPDGTASFVSISAELDRSSSPFSFPRCSPGLQQPCFRSGGFFFSVLTVSHCSLFSAILVHLKRVATVTRWLSRGCTKKKKHGVRSFSATPAPHLHYIDLACLKGLSFEVGALPCTVSYPCEYVR